MSIVDKILEKPDAIIIFSQLQTRINEEAKRRHEFREWLDEDKKAEFVNGQVIMHSPVKRKHLAVSEHLNFLIGLHNRLKNLGVLMYEKALIALTHNDYEPDAVFFRKEKTGKFTGGDQMLFPAPDFVVEILSKSTAKYDRGIKKDDYAAHGIEEYWIIDPTKRQIEQYLLIGDATTYMPPYIYKYDDDIESRVITGFKIPVAALFDDKINLQALQQLMKGE